MSLRHVLAGVGATVLFAVGVTAAFADTPPTTTDTTMTETTTTSEPTTTDSTSTTTDTTTTETTETTATSTTSLTTTTASPPQRATTPPPPLAHRPVPAVPTPQKKRHRKKRRISKPLKVTPPLGQRNYVFPVVGDVGYVDTYGDFRSDVHGKWHHGDDLFAPLGTPVVAVASGTVNRIGWRKAGGWRLWVRDSFANQFYYAHFSGYARSIFHSKDVRAGQVIGFVGNTGDAFPRASHLHFEIHPHQLLRLRYDGAVDPTTYLDSWTHLTSAPASRPLLPHLPKQPLVRREARLVFRQLLATRRVKEQTPPITSVTGDDHDRLAARFVPIPAAAPSPATGRNGLWQFVAAVLLGGVALALVSLGVLRARRRVGA